MLSNMIILWHSVHYQAVISKHLTDFDLVSLVSCLYLTFIGNDQDSLFSLIKHVVQSITDFENIPMKHIVDIQ